MRQICGYENLKKSHQRLFRWEVTDDLLIEAERLKRVLYIAELPGDEGGASTSFKNDIPHP